MGIQPKSLAAYGKYGIGVTNGESKGNEDC